MDKGSCLPKYSYKSGVRLNITIGTGSVGKRTHSKSKSVTAILVGGFLVFMTVGSGLRLFSVNAASEAQTLNNVQIQVQTTNSSLTSYYLTIYNSTGYPVISSSSQYSGFGAMLPNGAYLFIVTATLQYPYCCPITYATGSGFSSGATSTSPASNGSSVVYPVDYLPVEYGYAMKNISSATSFVIQTSSITDVPTSDVVAHVSYANETTVSGAYVQASIIGSYYYVPTSNWVMWGQTGTDGSFTLKIPNLPVEVYAYSSVYVNVPKNVTIYTTTIGGEKVNVTLYWQPTYVYFQGFALILPPQTSASITLHAQQPNYYVTPYARGETTPPSQSAHTSTTVTTGVSQQNLPTGPTNQPQIIPPFSSIATTSKSTSAVLLGSSSEQLLLGIMLAAVSIAAFSVAYALRRRSVTEK